MPMASTARTPRAIGVTAKRARQMQENLRRTRGDIRLSRNRAEGRGLNWNYFPDIARIFPDVLGDIVVETTEHIQAKAAARAPRARRFRPSDPEPGTLQNSSSVRYSRSKTTGAVVSGRIDFRAIDPTEREPKHNYALAVEVGTRRTPAQEFLLPAIIEERGIFTAALAGVEARLLP